MFRRASEIRIKMEMDQLIVKSGLVKQSQAHGRSCNIVPVLVISIGRVAETDFRPVHFLHNLSMPGFHCPTHCFIHGIYEVLSELIIFPCFLNNEVDGQIVHRVHPVEGPKSSCPSKALNGDAGKIGAGRGKNLKAKSEFILVLRQEYGSCTQFPDLVPGHQVHRLRPKQPGTIVNPSVKDHLQENVVVHGRRQESAPS